MIVSQHRETVHSTQMAALEFLRADFGPQPEEEDKTVTAASTVVMDGIANYIRQCYMDAADQRREAGIDDRMLAAMRAMHGKYDEQTLQEIKQFGGSTIYARITAGKTRACSALLREIYTSTSRPWALEPDPEPEMSGPSLDQVVREVLQAEVLQLQAAGGQVTPEALRTRMEELRDEVLQKRKKAAQIALETRSNTIDDVLWQGGFYEALWAFLGDIATFPVAVIKGPVVRMKNILAWEDDTPVSKSEPVPHWHRCSPFDVYFAPWSQTPQDGYIIHRERVSRQALQSLRGLPGYNTERIDRILREWSPGKCDWYNYSESSRASLELRESDNSEGSDGNEKPIPMLSFYGSISAKLLRDWGVKEDLLPHDDQDLSVFAYLVADQVIGVTVNPHPTGKLPFYTDSFDRVAGSCYGNAIPDLIGDIQAAGNAALRAMVNNLAMASGPMVWINEDRMASNDPNAYKLWPWKVFAFNDPATSQGSEKPMEFFQPNTNAHELLNIYQSLMTMADEISTIPRYMQGSTGGVGGAGRTAAGLSMLMEAAGRTVKQTVSSIDTNVIESIVEDLNIYLALTRPDVVRGGSISVVARGAVELMHREALRMRRIEFLGMTNNPVDQQLVGVEGRFNVLKEIARDLQLPVADSIALTPQQARAIQEGMMAQALAMTAGGGMTGNQTPQPQQNAPAVDPNQQQPQQPTQHAQQ